MFSRQERVLNFALTAITFCMPLSAQSFYSSIFGTITDVSGGVIPGAVVSVINTGTSEKCSTTTGDDGSYRVVSLIPGQYRVEVEIPGFRRFVREPITVEVQRTVLIDEEMELAARGESTIGRAHGSCEASSRREE